jgi:hypothetical protein
MVSRVSLRLRLSAALHELGCEECQVTWLSWWHRLIGDERGYTPWRRTGIQPVTCTRCAFWPICSPEHKCLSRRKRRLRGPKVCDCPCSSQSPELSPQDRRANGQR